MTTAYGYHRKIPLDFAGQQRASYYHNKNVVSVGGPDVPLTEPNRSTLVDTVGDGSCMFRAMSVVITGNQRTHVTIRCAIVKHLCDNEPLFIHKVWLFDMQYSNMEAYVEANNMRQHGWGSQLELFALALMLQRRVFSYSVHGNHWCCFCPSSKHPPSSRGPLQSSHFHQVVSNSVCDTQSSHTLTCTCV